jgi:two-component system sensor histidine kinase/response regulator
MNANILVIDDELGIRRGCQRALEPLGYQVAFATSFQEGQEKIAAENYDLVLLDVMMPDGRGIDLIPQILEKDPETIAVIITGYATVELAVEAVRRGAYDFIAKPFTSDVLLVTVNQGLEKRRLSLQARRLQSVEQEAARLAVAKAEADKLNQFKTEFTNMVTHELRAPVGGAQSLLRALLRGLAGELNPQQIEILKRIEGRLDELLELINDLLDLAASKTVAPQEAVEPIAVQPILQEVVDRFEPDAQAKNVQLVVRLPDDVVKVQATEDGLGKIFGNLVGNAIKYTPTGGRVTLEARQNGAQLAVSVADTGIGIPADDLDKIWEDFFRAKNAKRSGILGTGLGLSIVKELVDQYGGHIDVHSVEGQGTTFTLQLPLL